MEGPSLPPPPSIQGVARPFHSAAAFLAMSDGSGVSDAPLSPSSLSSSGRSMPDNPLQNTVIGPVEAAGLKSPSFVANTRLAACPDSPWQGHIRPAPYGMTSPSYVVYGMVPRATYWPACGPMPVVAQYQQPPSPPNSENQCSHTKLQCTHCRAVINNPSNGEVRSRVKEGEQGDKEYLYDLSRPPRRHCACSDDGCILGTDLASLGRRCNEHKRTRPHYSCKTATHLLSTWLEEHPNKPYPERDEKKRLAQQANMTMRQLQDWFGNARRRMRRCSSSRTGPASKRKSGDQREALSPHSLNVNNLDDWEEDEEDEEEEVEDSAPPSYHAAGDRASEPTTKDTPSAPDLIPID